MVIFVFALLAALAPAAFAEDGQTAPVVRLWPAAENTRLVIESKTNAVSRFRARFAAARRRRLRIAAGEKSLADIAAAVDISPAAAYLRGFRVARRGALTVRAVFDLAAAATHQRVALGADRELRPPRRGRCDAGGKAGFAARFVAPASIRRRRAVSLRRRSRFLSSSIRGTGEKIGRGEPPFGAAGKRCGVGYRPRRRPQHQRASAHARRAHPRARFVFAARRSGAARASFWRRHFLVDSRRFGRIAEAARIVGLCAVAARRFEPPRAPPRAPRQLVGFGRRRRLRRRRRRLGGDAARFHARRQRARLAKLGAMLLEELGKAHVLHSPRVEAAGFAVLKSPSIPSALVETAFLSNPDDEKKLHDPGFFAPASPKP